MRRRWLSCGLRCSATAATAAAGFRALSSFVYYWDFYLRPVSPTPVGHTTEDYSVVYANVTLSSPLHSEHDHPARSDMLTDSRVT